MADGSKKMILDEAAVKRTLVRMSHEMIEQLGPADEIAVVGIKRRGVSLAKLIADSITSFSDIKIRTGELDITMYRDDLTELSEMPTLNGTKIDFPITGKTVVLVDDVIYTGRTARAAIDALLSLGRPDCIRLAVLVDRGHRELPIRGDFVGKNLPTSRSERVSVKVPEYDGEYAVEIIKA